MFVEYIYLLKYFAVCFSITLLLFFVSFVFVFQNIEAEKVSVYECGFMPYGDSRGRFEVRFYLVAILFIVFDLELVFLFPWAMIIQDLTVVGYFSMCFFLYILLVGFVYEWVKGALDWN